MPCDTITKVTLELKNANLDTLQKAVESLGYSVFTKNQYGLRWQGGEYNTANGELVVRSEVTGSIIKRTYAAEMVKAKASQFGWRVKQVSAYKFQVQKG